MTRMIHTVFPVPLCVVTLGLCMIAVACGEANEDGQPVSTDSFVADTGTETDSAAAPEWEIELVSDMAAGIQTRLVAGPDDMLGLTWFANDAFDDGLCDEIAVNPPTRLRQRFYYGVKSGSASPWTVEEVDSPVITLLPTGLSLAYSPDGLPTIAYTGGVPEGQFCGGNDAVLATRTATGWQFETAASESGDSQTGIVGSDEGMVVGLWPALAYSASGEPAVVHKDAHFGALQSIDLRKADAEFAWRRGGGWIYEAIDANEGAGEPNALVFDGDTPIAVYGIPVETQQDSRKGVWAARRADDGTWEEKIQLHEGAISTDIAAGINPVTGELVVAFYSASDKAVRVRRLSDLSNFTNSLSWTSEIVTRALYDEGDYLSLAFTPQGKEVLAYHRCRLNSSTSDSCDQNDEAALLAIRTDGVWRDEVITASAKGSCGEYTSVAVDSRGVAHVVYRCTENDGDQYYFRLFVASKEIEAQ
ncbi:MAG: hypothetical protein JXX14_23605 [Deltaproteobacteria bacterium]|nr:hypothetical protein [Deltaproteobacteria bacterium]